MHAQLMYQSYLSNYLIGVLHLAHCKHGLEWKRKHAGRLLNYLVWLGLIHTLVCLLCAKERKCSASHVELALFTCFGLFADRCGHCRCPTSNKISCILKLAALKRMCLIEFRRDSLESSLSKDSAVLNWTNICLQQGIRA